MAAYREPIQTTTLDIVGMTCGGCVRSVEKTLLEVPGVKEAAVNFAGQSASVTGTPNTQALLNALQKAGYTGALHKEIRVADQEQKNISEFKKTFFKSLILLIAGTVLMADMWLEYLPPPTQTSLWLNIGLVTLVLMLFAGGSFFTNALRAASRRTVTMDTLVALGTGVAWLFSMFVVLTPQMASAPNQHLFFEAALLIIGFIKLGRAIELYTREDASLAIQKLYDLTPPTITLVEDGEERTVPTHTLLPNQQIRIKPGENLPVDGFITAGEGYLNESLLTGESKPLRKKEGDSVHAGTLNMDGSFILKALRVGQNTRLAAISRLVEQARNSKPQVARIVDRISSIFVPLVILTALITALTWGLQGAPLPFVLSTSMSVLIIACPCALGLAIPMSIMVGLGRAAEKGLLVKNSEVLQTATNLNVLVMDKTGTLTTGKPHVVAMKGLSPEVLQWLMATEQQATHPLAEAIVQSCADLSITPAPINNFHNHAGSGLTADTGSGRLTVGSLNFLLSQGIKNVPQLDTQETIVGVALDETFCGHLLLQDQMRPEAPAVIAQLKSAGIRTVLATGDRESVAQQIAKEAGIEEVHVQQSPEDKLQLVQSLQLEGLVVGMVGDGINDAAALSAAEVSIAMGIGADVAIDSADVTLRDNSLEGIPQVIHISKKVLRNVYQNLLAAFAYNVLLVPIAAGVLYTRFDLLINPSLAGLAMALSSVTVVLNAIRLRFS